MTDIELLPCPFCGGDKIEWDCLHRDERGQCNNHSLDCRDCGATIMSETPFSRAEAITAWNTRTTQGHDALVDAAQWFADQAEAWLSSREQHAKPGWMIPAIAKVRSALTNLPTPQPEAALDDGLLADLHTEADLCHNEGAEDIARLLDRAIAAITALRVRPSGDGLVAELENLAARTRGMWSFDQANELCALFPRILTALRARPSGDGEAE